MCTDSILNHLTQTSLITSVEQQSLRSANSASVFLGRLVKIYEDKTELFLRACIPSVKKELLETPSPEREALTIEKTMECALSTFFENDLFSVVPSLKLLLNTDSDLLISLGLKPSVGTLEIEKKALVGYIARYQLLRVIDLEQLHTLIENAEQENPHIFPRYFFNALRIEKEISLVIQSQLASQSEPDIAEHLSHQIQSSPELITACARGIIFYLGNLIKQATISEELSDRYFNHLNDESTQMAFSCGIAQGFLETMSQRNEIAQILNTQSLIVHSNVYKICLPALKLLGVQIDLNLTDIHSALQGLQDRLQANATQLAAYEAQINAAKEAAFQQIAQWRASIPDRPITFGIKIGLVPFNLK